MQYDCLFTCCVSTQGEEGRRDRGRKSSRALSNPFHWFAAAIDDMQFTHIWGFLQFWQCRDVLPLEKKCVPSIAPHWSPGKLRCYAQAVTYLFSVHFHKLSAHLRMGCHFFKLNPPPPPTKLPDQHITRESTKSIAWELNCVYECTNYGIAS